MGPMPTSSPMPTFVECPVGLGNSLCPNSDLPCKYKGGGDNWDYSSSCEKIEGYTDISLERDPDDHAYLSEAAKNACEAALNDMISLGINVSIGNNLRKSHIFSMYSNERPPGCFIECNGGKLFGYFNVNSGSHITEKTAGHYAESLCVKIDGTTSSPTTSPPTTSPTGKPFCTDDIAWNFKGNSCSWVREN